LLVARDGFGGVFVAVPGFAEGRVAAAFGGAVGAGFAVGHAVCVCVLLVFLVLRRWGKSCGFGGWVVLNSGFGDEGLQRESWGVLN
jgi:hypothetical protein